LTSSSERFRLGGEQGNRANFVGLRRRKAMTRTGLVRGGFAALATCVGFGVPLLAAPSALAHCGKWGDVKGFQGTAGDIDFDGTATGSDGENGHETVQLSRDATNLRIVLSARIPKRGSGQTEFLGKTKEGVIFVDDEYTDDNSGEITTGRQRAHGTDVNVILTAVSTLVLHPDNCTYQLLVGFGARTESTGQWPPLGPDKGVSGVALTPERHIPVSLKLSGSAKVPAFYSGCPSQHHSSGCYQFAGLPGGGSAWEQEYDTVFSCGSSQPPPQGCPDDQKEGGASFDWTLKPQFRKPKRKK
jgi:hypothetical protein